MISVILPAYNEEKYLPEMLDCLEKQTYQDFEVLAVDDGSKDGTLKIFRDFADAHPGKVTVIAQENAGLSASRNHAMDRAAGEYIVFLDADDRIPENYLEKLYTAARENDADLVKCSFEDFDESGKHFAHVSAGARLISYRPGRHYLFQYSPWAGILKRSFLERYHLRFSVGEQMEDSPFALMTNQLAERFAAVNDVTYCHRVHGNSIMTEVSRGKKDPKIPYRGIEEAIRTVRGNAAPVEKDFSDYCFCRVLSDYATLRYKTQPMRVRRELIAFIQRMMDTYFPNFPDNPYLKSGELKELPLFERTAVRMFARNYQRGTLLPFSACVSLALRML